MHPIKIQIGIKAKINGIKMENTTPIFLIVGVYLG
jgi:hypothetical protein